MDRSLPNPASLVSDTSISRWRKKHGQAAEEWVIQSHSQLKDLQALWNLREFEVLTGGSESIVVAAKQNQREVVVKLLAPWADHTETIALEAWSGNHVPALLDKSGSALLMERILPGGPALNLPPDKVAILLTGLEVTERPSGLPDLSQAAAVRFSRAQENRHGLVPEAELSAATARANQLALRPAKLIGLVHGDLLKKNILEAGSRLVAIDPMPSWGDRSFDAALWCATEEPTADAPKRADEIEVALGLSPGAVSAWLPCLLVAQACLTSAFERARRSLTLARALRDFE